MLLEQSRAHNGEHQATELSAVREDNAMQSLEGLERDVQALFERIAVDPRRRVAGS